MKRRFRSKPHQIPVALFILRQHQKVVVLVAVALGPVIVGLADIELTPENRLDPLLLGRVEEVHRPEDIAVIGHRHGLLPDLLHMRGEFIDVARAIEQGVVGMQMQVGKFSGHTISLSRAAAAARVQIPFETFVVLIPEVRTKCVQKQEHCFTGIRTRCRCFVTATRCYHQENSF